MEVIGIMFTIIFIVAIIFIVFFSNFKKINSGFKDFKDQMKKVVKNIQDFEDKNFNERCDENQEIDAEYEEHIKCEYCGSSFSKSLKNCPNCGASVNDNKDSE